MAMSTKKTKKKKSTSAFSKEGNRSLLLFPAAVTGLEPEWEWCNRDKRFGAAKDLAESTALADARRKEWLEQRRERRELQAEELRQRLQAGLEKHRDAALAAEVAETALHDQRELQEEAGSQQRRRKNDEIIAWRDRVVVYDDDASAVSSMVETDIANNTRERLERLEREETELMRLEEQSTRCQLKADALLADELQRRDLEMAKHLRRLRTRRWLASVEFEAAERFVRDARLAHAVVFRLKEAALAHVESRRRAELEPALSRLTQAAAALEFNETSFAQAVKLADEAAADVKKLEEEVRRLKEAESSAVVASQTELVAAPAPAPGRRASTFNRALHEEKKERRREINRRRADIEDRQAEASLLLKEAQLTLRLAIVRAQADVVKIEGRMEQAAGAVSLVDVDVTAARKVVEAAERPAAALAAKTAQIQSQLDAFQAALLPTPATAPCCFEALTLIVGGTTLEARPRPTSAALAAARSLCSLRESRGRRERARREFMAARDAVFKSGRELGLQLKAERLLRPKTRGERLRMSQETRLRQRALQEARTRRRDETALRAALDAEAKALSTALSFSCDEEAALDDETGAPAPACCLPAVAPAPPKWQLEATAPSRAVGDLQELVTSLIHHNRPQQQQGFAPAIALPPMTGQQSSEEAVVLHLWDLSDVAWLRGALSTLRQCEADWARKRQTLKKRIDRRFRRLLGSEEHEHDGALFALLSRATAHYDLEIFDVTSATTLTIIEATTLACLPPLATRRERPTSPSLAQTLSRGASRSQPCSFTRLERVEHRDLLRAALDAGIVLAVDSEDRLPQTSLSPATTPNYYTANHHPALLSTSPEAEAPAPC